MSLYDDLGVPKNADRAAIKRAYRKKAQKLHPDRPHGDAEKFHAVTRAYHVLYDDALRAYYDQHGSDGTRDRQGDLTRRLAALFIQLIETQDVDHTDIVVLMRQALLDGKEKTKQDIRQAETKIAKFEKVRKRITKKGGGDNLFLQMLDGHISQHRRGIEMGNAEIANVDDMLKIIADYQYHADQDGYATMCALAQMAGFRVFR